MHYDKLVFLCGWLVNNLDFQLKVKLRNCEWHLTLDYLSYKKKSKASKVTMRQVDKNGLQRERKREKEREREGERE